MSKVENATVNTAMAPVRAGGSFLNVWFVDTMKTAWNVLTDLGKVTKSTGKEIWNVLSSSWTEGKWYNKLYQCPASIAVSAWGLVEWAVRLVFEPIRNVFLNVRDAFWNFFRNIWNTISTTFSTSKTFSDFSYETLKLKEPTKKNWFSKLAWWKK